MVAPRPAVALPLPGMVPLSHGAAPTRHGPAPSGHGPIQPWCRPTRTGMHDASAAPQVPEAAGTA